MIDYTVPLDQLPDPLPIQQLSKPFNVSITPPGSKSITCRAYMLAALRSGWVIRPGINEDTQNLRFALEHLGAVFHSHYESPSEIWVDGVQGRFPRGGKLVMGEGAAPTRFLMAAACLATEDVSIDASSCMRQRPISEGVELLRQLGASIEYTDGDGKLPVRILASSRIRGGEVSVGATHSSQFISALMLIAPCLERGLKINFTAPLTSRTYVELTKNVMRAAGISVQDEADSVRIPFQTVKNDRIIVEPDATSATYWFAAAAMAYSGSVRVILPKTVDESFTNWQGDWQFPEILEQMGAFVQTQRASLFVRSESALNGVDCDMSSMPDAAVTLAALCAVCNGRSTITGLRTLRYKESDRLTALAAELRRIGCTIATGDDWITIDPSTRHDHPATIETYNDHRIAMAFAVLGLVRPNIAIRNPACVKKSYPTFWQDFAKLYQ
ncbi:MAG TPA: 3-phosphoshikimate 1-carboxyvinyltransferase [Phycisphaerales bacterium]|nr:3-phosphoshikimate 1-carboxyvinyltransferase [Phycisphaerales bacterium]